MKKFTLFVGAALLAASGVAIAQQPGGRGPMADMTRDQALARADQRFVALDLNRDGRVNPAEAREAGAARRTERQGQMFERLDTDRNGQISRGEFSARQTMRTERREARGDRPNRGMRGQRGERSAARMFGPSGEITREAFRERALRRFERVDANRDGTITADERRGARERMRTQRRERRAAPAQN